LAGWYGLGTLASKLGATDGDQTTGGLISFGRARNSNRALGLLATSSTGPTAFGAKFVNETGESLNQITVQLTGELWRQSDLSKTLQCYYYIDPTGAAPFPAGPTGLLPALDVSFPINPTAAGGIAVDGTVAINQTNLSTVNQKIVTWPAGSALWLVWQMADPAGKAQGLAIDNLTFSASNQALPSSVSMSFQISGTNLVLSWAGVAGKTYQVEYKSDLAVNSWTALGSPIPGTGTAFTFTTDFTQSAQRYYRIRIVP
jgi:hypothetical protein